MVFSGIAGKINKNIVPWGIAGGNQDRKQKN
jgi:hypothetical protein